MVDEADYDGSWQQAATFFQRSVSRAKWREAAAHLRGPAGRLIRRKLTKRLYTEALPGAPSGQHVVNTYRTDFDYRKGAEETVTTTFEGTRGWRVSGYQIRLAARLDP